MTQTTQSIVQVPLGHLKDLQVNCGFIQTHHCFNLSNWRIDTQSLHHVTNPSFLLSLGNNSVLVNLPVGANPI